MVGTRSGGGSGSASHGDGSGDQISLQGMLSMIEALMSKFEGMQKDIEEVKRDQTGLRFALSVDKPVDVNDAGNGDSVAKDVAEMSVRTLRDPVSDGTSLLSIGEVHKIYSRELSDDRVSKLGDARFLAAKMTWDRLMQDFPFEAGMQRRLVGLAFVGAVKRIYESTAATHMSASAEELWEPLRAKLFNKSQQRTQRASFYAAKWQERSESVEQFGARLASSAMSLPEDVPQELLIHQFVEGLPVKLRTSALLISGSYDEVVAKTSLVSASMPTRAGSKPVRMASENGRQGNDWGRSRQGEVHQDYRGLGVSRGRTPYHEKKCYYCSEIGHIQRFCPRRQAERNGTSGKGNGQEIQAQANLGSHP